MPFKDFQPAVLSSADVNTYLMKQSVMVFDDATARSTALTSPVEGMVTYLKDTNKTFQYDGANWLEVVKLDSAGRLFNTTQPRFLANRLTNQTGYTNGSQVDLLICNNVISNQGNHYNGTNGRFTAPVSGNYVFGGGALSSSNLLQLWFVVNGARERTFAWQAAGGVIAGSDIIYLNQNDWVGISVWTGGATVTLDANFNHTYFRGCLIN